MFCKYKNILGKINEGIHSYRICDIAIMDVILTILGSFLIKKNIFPKYNFLNILIIMFIIGIISHRLFCVRTTIDKFLFK